MLHWVEKTTKGLMICLFCGSLVTQIGQAWFCNEPTCKKYTDEPVIQRQTDPIYPNTTIISTGTISSSTTTTT